MKDIARRVRRLSAAAVVLCAALAASPAAPQDLAAADSAILAEGASKAAEGWAQRRKVYLGPTVIDDVVYTTVSAVAAACWGTAAQCKSAKDPQGFASSVTAYLETLLGNPTGTELTGDRIFTRIGFDKSRLGWPSGPAANRYIAAVLPEGFTSLSHVTWNGKVAIANDPTVVLVPMGVHGFVGIRRQDGRPTLLRLMALRDADGKAQIEWIAERGTDAAHSMPWRVDPELSRFCLSKPVDPTEPKYRLSTGRGAPPIASASDFHGAEILRVRLATDERSCDAGCRAGVAASVIQALAQWRAGCTRCRPYTLSVVEVEASVFVSVRLIETALQWPYLRPQKNANGVLASEVANMATTQGSGVDVRMGFQRVDGVAPALGLCTSSGPTQGTPGFAVLSPRARDRVCQPPSSASCIPAAGCKEITLRLSGAQDCANALACGFPDQSVTLNTPRFKFGLMGTDPALPPTITLGQAVGGQRQAHVALHPVLLHEVGHWFGLPHVDSDPGPDDRDEVMIDTGGDDRVCISRAALNMLDSAVDQTWQFRQAVKGMLRYAPR